ncbi:MAG TPA: DUF3107 domain-containing protein [Nocardioidaceae bacterium]|nr:DUF3107 domain-containing protein [Nocardioidaceae bacterium]
MEVKIGILHASRELVFESSEGRDDILALVHKAIGDGDVIELMDSKGRTIVVPSDRLAYVEIGDEGQRRTGFVS